MLQRGKVSFTTMPKINEATDTDPCLILAEPAPYLIRGTSLKVIERLQQLGWKRGVTLLYQQEYALNPEYQKIFEGRKA